MYFSAFVFYVFHCLCVPEGYILDVKENFEAVLLTSFKDSKLYATTLRIILTTSALIAPIISTPLDKIGLTFEFVSNL